MKISVEKQRERKKQEIFKTVMTEFSQINVNRK